ncbi:MAG TPA: hypothetical protein VGJ00_04255 [Rhabdochlamydiaceae bacterium]
MIGEHFLVRPLDIVAPSGKKTKILIFELLGFQKEETIGAATPEQKELCHLFTEAFDRFKAGNLAEAKKLFTVIHQKFPEDFPTQIYLDRLKDN